MDTNRSQTDSMQKSSVKDVLSQSFPSFDHNSSITEPFDEEAKRDTEFRRKFNALVLELLLELHAWSTSRPMSENDRTSDVMEKDINEIIRIEHEQGRSSAPHASLVEKTRQRLMEFIDRIKSALAALTGI